MALLLKQAPMLKFIPNYIYFYHLDEYCILPLYPDQITDNMASTFQQTNSLSRSAPVFTFSNSGPRSVRIDLDLHRDLINDLNKNNPGLIKKNVKSLKTEDYMDVLLNYLQAAALPKYSSYNTSTSKSVIPPMVAIRFGNDIFIKGVVDSGVSVTYKKPIMSNNKYATMSVSFSVYEVDPFDAKIVSEEGSFRGITSTFKSGIFAEEDSSIGSYSENRSVIRVNTENEVTRGSRPSKKSTYKIL